MMSDVNTMLERAKSALIARDYTLAAKIYKSLILEEPDNIDYKMQLGNLYVKAGHDDQALTLFKQIEKSDNENLEALIAISGVYRRQKKYEESVAFLEQALVICENDPKSKAKISYNLGFTYRQMGNYDDAIQCFEEVVDDNPSDVLANNHLGAIYALQGKHTKAIEAYNRGLKFDANHPILQFNIAKSYAEIGEISKAQSFYEGALRAKPGWTEAIEAYADLLLYENKVSEADEVVTQSLKINPDDVKMHTAKGNVFTRQSIFDEAESEYKKALDVDETYRNALTGLAHSLENQGKFVEAVETIRKAESLNPDDMKIMKQSAHIHISANKLEDARDTISRLQKLDANDAQTINLLGQYYICSGDAGKAEECFAAIKKINPDYNDVYRDWGERFLQKGDEKKAEPYLQAAIQKNPADSTAMVYLGELYEKQNLVGKALQFYKKASSADSFNQRSRAASARIMGDDERMPSLDNAGNAAQTVDYDSLFSGGKVSSGDDFGEKMQGQIQGIPSVNNASDAADLISDVGEISLADDDASFSEDALDMAEMPGPSSEGKSGDDFSLDQFGMKKLADASADSEDVSSVASLLASGEDAAPEETGHDFGELIDDGAPVDEEDAPGAQFVPVADGAEYLDDSASEAVEVETPGAQKREISDESLDMLEEQIKRAAELAEKANYAAESAWKAAAKAADAAQAIDEAKNTEQEPEEAEEPSEEELNAEEELADSDLLAAEELLTEDDISEAEGEDDDFLDDIPDYLQEESEETVAESQETEENNNIEETTETGKEEEAVEETESEKETPKIDDVTLRRAIDMLPSIIAAIEDRSVIYRFRSFLSMFKTLREMLDYLPDSQRREFMTSRNRLLLDYVISKLSGKPGLYATTKALLRSGLIHENHAAKVSEKEGIELVKEVLADLRELSESLEDESLRDVLNKEADGLEQII